MKSRRLQKSRFLYSLVNWGKFRSTKKWVKIRSPLGKKYFKPMKSLHMPRIFYFEFDLLRFCEMKGWFKCNFTSIMISWWTRSYIYVKLNVFNVIFGHLLNCWWVILLVRVIENVGILTQLTFAVAENCLFPRCRVMHNEDALLMMWYHGILPRVEQLKIHEHSSKYKIIQEQLLADVLQNSCS